MNAAPPDRRDPEPRPTFIDLDGSHGEGGGQILRSALSLSLCTGQPFRLRRLRAALRHCQQHAAAARVWFTVPREIAEFCYRLEPGLIP